MNERGWSSTGVAGVIGGLAAQNLKLDIAAELGVFIHAVAADRAALEGGERGLLACDLMKHLRCLVNPAQNLGEQSKVKGQ